MAIKSRAVLPYLIPQLTAKPVNTMIGKTKENQLRKLWQILNNCEHMEMLR